MSAKEVERFNRIVRPTLACCSVYLPDYRLIQGAVMAALNEAHTAGASEQAALVRDLTAALVAAVKEHVTPETCDFTYETWQLIKDALSGVDIDAGELV